MVKFTDICEDVGEKAYKEHHIEKTLKKMKSEWEGMDFLLPQFKNTPTSTIAGFDDAMQMFDEHLV